MNESDHPHVLTIEDRFSVSEMWQNSSFSIDVICELSHSCHEVLSAVILLEQMAMEQASSVPNKQSSEVHRLEQKVDFLTELMSNVLLSQIDMPDRQSIQMSAEHIVWHSKNNLDNHQYCLLSIYLTRKYPLPLKLPVRVIKKRSGSQFEGQILLSKQQAIDDLTRVIFLFHRRQVARKKTKN